MTRTPSVKTAAGPGIGLVLGVAIGAATDNIGLGVALGLVFGAALGTAGSRKEEADPPKKD